MIVVNRPMHNRQISIRNTLSKFSIITPLLKNKNRDKLAFKSRQHLNKVDDFSFQNHIVISKKQTKIYKSAHKLHSLHRSHNKL